MDHGLVQIGDNTRRGLAIICNCCSCCCDLLLGYKRFGSTGLVSPSAFVADIRTEPCNDCGICADRCPVDVIKMTEDGPVIDSSACLGCGVCARFCPTEACHLTARPERPFVPEDILEKIGLAAIDSAKLGNYLFDNQESRIHAVLRFLTNLTLKLSPVRRLLRSKPVWSRIRGAARNTNSYRNV
ncbi:indolepyruvate ferredoxin oxidoreductase subunit alpha [Candidatus Latescibacterota bacterium]